MAGRAAYSRAVRQLIRCRYEVRAALKHLLIVLRARADILPPPEFTPQSIQDEFKQMRSTLTRSAAWRRPREQYVFSCRTDFPAGSIRCISIQTGASQAGAHSSIRDQPRGRSCAQQRVDYRIFTACPDRHVRRKDRRALWPGCRSDRHALREDSRPLDRAVCRDGHGSHAQRDCRLGHVERGLAPCPCHLSRSAHTVAATWITSDPCLPPTRYWCWTATITAPRWCSSH